MINFNSKYFTLLVWVVTAYLFYRYSNGLMGSEPQAGGDKITAADAVISIDIDPNKSYKDYTILQKIAYHFYREQIDAEVAKYQAKKDRIKQIPVVEGATIVLSYSVDGGENQTEKIKIDQEAVLSALPEKKIHDDIIGLYDGESKFIRDGNKIIKITILSTAQ